MASRTALAATIRCNGCRTHFLRSVASLAGLDLPWNNLGSKAQRRTLITTSSRLSDRLSHRELLRLQDIGDALDDSPMPAPKPTTSPVAATSSDTPIPWYLQKDAAQQPLQISHPLSERQRLPDLPDHSPPILEGLLQHVSVDLGIDDITLLDLRHLDPPPALGANLLMLFGTARSEKHLHVSADRLCRWLRSQHKLSPHADGLLGRNELKLKLRRKARKLRMLANVGASETSLAADDGIRTDWICVNIGRVEAAEPAKAVAPKQEGFVGFGGSSEGVNIVFQLFTEDKRVELDLERLWNGVRKTDARRKEAQLAGVEAENQTHSSHNTNGAVLADQTVTTSSPFPQFKDPRAPLQVRILHTSTTARRDGRVAALSRAGQYGVANRWVRTGRSAMSTSAGRREAVVGPQNDVESRFDHATAGWYDPEIALANLVMKLDHLSAEERMAALGKSAKKTHRDTSEFLQQFYSNIPPLPNVDHYVAVLQLFIHAISLNHPGYPVTIVNSLLIEMQVALLRIPEYMFLDSLRIIMSREHPDDISLAIPTNRNEVVFSILDSMQAYDYPVNTDEIILLLHDAVSIPFDVLESQLSSASIADERAKYNRVARRRLLDKIDLMRIPLKQDSFLHLLHTYAMLNDMQSFWRVWSNIALHMHSRTAEMYELALDMAAQTGSMTDCVYTLRKTVSDIERELPPVALKGEVAYSAMECIKVAEPNIETQVNQRLEGEWTRLWVRCQKAVREELEGEVSIDEEEQGIEGLPEGTPPLGYA